MIGIYKITNPKGCVYIGQSANIERRKNDYLFLKQNKQPKLYNSLKKYGFDKHKFEIVIECEKEQLNELERYYQELYSCIGKGGLNCVLVDTNKERKVISDEMKKRMSVSQKGKIISEETKKRMSERMKRDWAAGKRPKPKKGRRLTEEQKERYKGKNNPFYGKKHPQSVIDKISKFNTGRKWTKESIQKRTLKQKGLKRSELTKQRLSASLKGKKFSEERKLRLSAASYISKPVLNLETGIFYDSIKNAAKTINISKSTLERRMNGKIKKSTSFCFI